MKTEKGIGTEKSEEKCLLMVLMLRHAMEMQPCDQPGAQNVKKKKIDATLKGHDTGLSDSVTFPQTASKRMFLQQTGR